jgi:hypothetical protein
VVQFAVGTRGRLLRDRRLILGLTAGLIALVASRRRKPCERAHLERGGLIATITSRGSWRTAAGLRVGNSVARLRALYPRAKLRTGSFDPRNGYWLLTRHMCAEVGGSPYPGLLARLRAGRVSALVASGTVCD